MIALDFELSFSNKATNKDFYTCNYSSRSNSTFAWKIAMLPSQLLVRSSLVTRDLTISELPKSLKI